MGYLLFFFVLLLLFTMVSGFLVPSQTIRTSKELEQNSNRRTKKSTKPIAVPSSLLIPSQIFGRSLKALPTEQQQDAGAMGKEKQDLVAAFPNSDSNNKRPRRRKRPHKKRAAAAEKKDNNAPLTFGNQPNVSWRSIPLEHLRFHPRFRPLPERVTELSDLEQVRQFRQESWQWEVLHRGRCTTSQAVAALGFLEPSVGEVLGVPPGWRKGGRGAFSRLRQEPLRTLEEMNQVLCNSKVDVSIKKPTSASSLFSEESSNALWSEASDDEVSSSDNFVARYNYQLSEHELKDRKKLARKFSENEDLGRSIRIMWGNTQEATALLSALNYFGKEDPDFVLEEIGMCGAGLDLNRTDSSSLLIGASPDGLLRHSNGTIEALEVKNHCPFYSLRTKKKHNKMKRFNLSSLPLDAAGKGGGVFAHFVPQLQMEMLCLGPECRSAVMVRQTATAGALVLRMHRDDHWIDEMVYWLHRFYLDFVENNVPPPTDFFWNATDSEDRSRFRRFVNKTNEIRRSKVDVVGFVPNDDVQRMQGDDPLFLD